jgi:hypothetical protein
VRFRERDGACPGVRGQDLIHRAPCVPDGNGKQEAVSA